jgi:hypothetical protein
MALESLFKDLLPDSVTIEPFASVDGYGKPSYSTGVAYVCRVEYKTRLAKNAAGETVVSTATTYLSNPLAGLSVRDRITLPDGSQPVIITVEKQPYKSPLYYAAILT